MVTIRVEKPFRDLITKDDRVPGETFEATKERADHIASALPGYITVMEQEEPQPDYSKMTVKQLGELLEERGIEIPKGARKAQLIELLGG